MTTAILSKMSYETRANILRSLHWLLSDNDNIHSLLDDTSSLIQPTEFYSQP